MIIIGTLLDIIALHLGRRDVAVVDMHALVGLFVKNVVVVEERKWFDARIIGKAFLPIQPILKSKVKRFMLPSVGTTG